MSSQTELIESITTDILGPWQKACNHSDYPWIATPELKGSWMEMLKSSDSLTRITGFIGITRASELTNEEYNAAADFLRNYDTEEYDDTFIVFLLLNGASPPMGLYEQFFAQFFEVAKTTDINFWVYFSRFLRHPFTTYISSLIIEKGTPLQTVLYMSALNPTIIPGDYTLPNNLWFNALKVFHPLSPQTTRPSINDNPLNIFAYFLRTDFEKEYFNEISNDYFIEDPLFFAILENPCRLKGKCPEYSPFSPSRASINFFGEDTLFCSLWRHYNPLLNFPWLFDTIDASTDPSTIFGTSFLGGPLGFSLRSSLMDNKSIKSILEAYPLEINFQS